MLCPCEIWPFPPLSITPPETLALMWVLHSSESNYCHSFCFSCPALEFRDYHQGNQGCGGVFQHCQTHLHRDIISFPPTPFFQLLFCYNTAHLSPSSIIVTNYLSQTEPLIVEPSSLGFNASTSTNSINSALKVKTAHSAITLYVGIFIYYLEK